MSASPRPDRPAVITRPVRPGDRAGWQALYEAYQLFYDRPGLPQGFYDTAFARLMPSAWLYSRLPRRSA